MYESNQLNQGSAQELDEQPQYVDTSHVKSGGSKKVIAVLLAAVVLMSGGYVIMKRGGGKFTINSPAGTAPAGKNLSEAEQKKQVADVLAAVGKLIILPKDDEPVLARVEDPDSLTKQQAFFSGSQKGDTLLIFPKAQRAILYSPSRNLIVNSGPIIAGDQGAQSSAGSQAQLSSQAPQSASVPPSARGKTR